METYSVYIDEIQCFTFCLRGVVNKYDDGITLQQRLADS